jgi:type I restriction enzyme, S subunit
MKWPVVSFGSVCDLVNGRAFKPTDWSDSGVPIVRIQNLNGEGSSFNYWSGPLDKQVRVQSGDMLLAWSGTPGTSFGAHIWRGPQAVLNQHIFRVDLDQSRVAKDWAVFAVNHQLNELIALAHGGVGLKHVTRGVVEELKVPLPPLGEQQRLSGILNHAEALLIKRRAVLAQLDTFTQSFFLDVFGDPAANPKGWPLVSLPSVVFFQEGPGVRNWQFRTKGIKLVNVRNIVDGQLVTENTERYLDPREIKERYKHFLLDAGDLVVASSGVTWGKIARVELRHLPLCLNTSMIRLRPLNGKVEATFIRAFVESPAFRRQILRLITGSAQPNFGPAHLKQVTIALPPISVQQEFSRSVQAVDKLKATHRVSLAKMETLFSSLQHRAFRGEL